MRVKFRMQTGEQDCLLACYSMAVSSLGIDLLPHELYDGDALPADGLKASYLRQIDQSIGTRTRAYRDPGAEWTREVFTSFNGPAIAHWNSNHFVVVASMSRTHVRVFDPALDSVYRWRTSTAPLPECGSSSSRSVLRLRRPVLGRLPLSESSSPGTCGCCSSV